MSLSLRFLFAIAGTTLYFLLAVLGEGSFTPFLTNPPLIALLASTILIAIAALFAGGNVNPGEKEDRRNRWVLTALIILGLIAGFLPAYTDRIDFWTIDGNTTRWIGVVLYLLGGALRLWPVVVLGNRFSGLVAIQKDHTLVTTGIYRYIRHPSYAGMILNAAGWALAFRSVVGLILVGLMLIPIAGRIVAEERLLRSHFGVEYEAYCQRTTRLIPGVL